MSENNKITIEDWKRYFPFNIVRREQERAINFALNAFINEKKKFVIMELPTGVGKSASAIAISQYIENHAEPLKDDADEELSGTYVLTTQKLLVQQYVDDFGPGEGPGKNLLRDIKSSTNYKCKYYTDQSCAESRRLLTVLKKQLSGSEFQKCCKGSGCNYAADKSAFLESPISITNFSYFLAETLYSGKLQPRGLLVIDECHNIETELGKFIEVVFSEKFSKDTLKCKMPSSDSQQDVFEWVIKKYKPALSKLKKSLEKQLEKLPKDVEGYGVISKQYELLDKHLCKINRFIEKYDPKNWIMNVIRPTLGSRSMLKYEFKSIDISKYSHDLLFKFGGRVLLLSATIVDKDIFCKSIGVDPNDASFITIPSPFPIENRPIHYVPVGSMSMNNIEKTLPVLAEAVSMIIQQHPNVKGMIHTTNFKIANYLMNNVKSPRLLTHNSENREQVLQKHIDGSEPTILVSPSMMEGVDLADDASRFQILCKVPFPFLGDLLIKKRMENNREWYTYQTVKSVIQSFGRSIRNASDYAESYILDSDWERFYQMNKKMFPIEFGNTIKS